MNVDKSKIVSNEEGEIEILNVKLDDDVPKYVKERGIYPSYHLSKITSKLRKELNKEW